MTESSRSFLRSTHLRSTLFLTALLIAAGVSLTALRSTAEIAHKIPGPAIDEQAEASAQAAGSEVAVLAGDAFGACKASFSTSTA